MLQSILRKNLGSQFTHVELSHLNVPPMQVSIFLTFRLPFGRLLQKKEMHTVNVFKSARKKFTMKWKCNLYVTSH